MNNPFQLSAFLSQSFFAELQIELFRELLEQRAVIWGCFTVNKHRRTSIEINCDILQACKQGGTKTRVVYQANLNNLRISHYLESLLNTGMLAKEQDRYGNTVYRTTPLGVEFLRGYEKETKFKGYRILK